jgi:sec-independent protein translocase protein TatA
MGISWRELLVVLVIVLLVFGAKKLRNVGADLGSAVKGFKKAMNDGDEAEQQKQLKHAEEEDATFATREESRHKADDKVSDKANPSNNKNV